MAFGGGRLAELESGVGSSNPDVVAVPAAVLAVLKKECNGCTRRGHG